MAGALGIEPRSSVLETDILTVVLCPYNLRLALGYYTKYFGVSATFNCLGRFRALVRRGRRV